MNDVSFILLLFNAEKGAVNDDCWQVGCEERMSVATPMPFVSCICSSHSMDTFVCTHRKSV